MLLQNTFSLESLQPQQTQPIIKPQIVDPLLVDPLLENLQSQNEQLQNKYPQKSHHQDLHLQKPKRIFFCIPGQNYKFSKLQKFASLQNFNNFFAQLQIFKKISQI